MEAVTDVTAQGDFIKYVTLDGVSYGVMANLATLMYYEQEFSTDKHKADLIKDAFGVIDLTHGGKEEVITAEYIINRLTESLSDNKRLPKTTVELINRAFPAKIATVIDYTQDNWTSYVRILWAMLRTYEDYKLSTDSGYIPKVERNFNAWIQKVTTVDLDAISRVVIPMCQTQFFHTQR